MTNQASPIRAKRDFETAFPDVPQSSPYKKSRKDPEPPIKTLEITTSQKAHSTIAHSVVVISSPSSLEERVAPFDNTITTKLKQAQLFFDTGRQLAHQPNKEDKLSALNYFFSAANAYIQSGQKRPPQILFRIMCLQYELKNFSASIKSSYELITEGGAAYFIPIQINNMLCAIRMKDWNSFNSWLYQFKACWSDRFWLNPITPPPINENYADQFIKQTISKLENMLAISQEKLEKEKLLQALFTFSFALQNYRNAFAFANQLHEINPILASTPQLLCQLTCGNQEGKQQIPHIFKYF